MVIIRAETPHPWAVLTGTICADSELSMGSFHKGDPLVETPMGSFDFGGVLTLQQCAAHEGGSLQWTVQVRCAQIRAPMWLLHQISLCNDKK